MADFIESRVNAYQENRNPRTAEGRAYSANFLRDYESSGLRRAASGWFDANDRNPVKFVADVAGSLLQSFGAREDVKTSKSRRINPSHTFGTIASALLLISESGAAECPRVDVVRDPIIIDYTGQGRRTKVITKYYDENCKKYQEVITYE